MPYDATGATVDFALINYSNKIGIPILSKSAKIKKGEESSYNWAEVILNPQDTAALYGKYIYQLTIKDMWGDVSIPNQGIMLITKNINQLFCI